MLTANDLSYRIRNMPKLQLLRYGEASFGQMGSGDTITADTYKAIVNIVVKRDVKSHLKIVFSSRQYIANIPEDQINLYKDIVELVIYKC